jgi:N-hydroxyarylamine O-acetyltransferase
VARELSDFTEMCDFQQYSPESHFKKGKLCSIMIPHGRKTLTDRSFIVTIEGEKKEVEIMNEPQFYERLASEFGIAPSSV